MKIKNLVVICACFFVALLWKNHFYYKLRPIFSYSFIQNSSLSFVNFSSHPVIHWNIVNLKHYNSNYGSSLYVIVLNTSSNWFGIKSLPIAVENSRDSCLHDFGIPRLTPKYDFFLNASHLTKVASGWVDGHEVVLVAFHDVSSSIENTSLHTILLSSQLKPIWSRQLILPIDIFQIRSLQLQFVNCHLNDCDNAIVFLEYAQDSEDFSRFALSLSLATGDFLWKYFEKPPTVLKDQDRQRRNVSSPIFQHWKLQNRSRRGIDLRWRNYRKEIASLLPIRWHSEQDSLIIPINPTAAGGPNLVAIVYCQGIAILDSESGQELAFLHIHMASGQTIADWSIGEGDDVSLVRIATSSRLVPSPFLLHATGGDSIHDEWEEETGNGGDFSHTVDCFARISSNSRHLRSNDPSNKLFLIRGLCRPHSIFNFPRFGRKDWLEDDAISVPPVIISQFNQPTKLYFLTSDGSLSSVNTRGRELWRVDTQVSWLQMSRTISLRQASDEPVSDSTIYSTFFRPSLTPVNLVPINADSLWFGYTRLRSLFRKPEDGLLGLLAIGWNSISLVDRESGELLATHDLPCPPSSPAWILALTNASSSLGGCLFVVIVPCNELVIGMALQASLQWWVFLASFLLLLSSYAIAYWLLEMDIFSVY